MSEHDESEVFETGALHDDAETEDQAMEGVTDFEPDADWVDEHGKNETGGPGGVVNYDEKLRPEGWEYVEGESTPKVVDGNVEEA